MIFLLVVSLFFLLTLFSEFLDDREDGLLDQNEDVLVAGGGRDVIRHNELGILLGAHAQVVERRLLVVLLVVETAEGLLGLQDKVGDKRRVLNCMDILRVRLNWDAVKVDHYVSDDTGLLE